MLIWKNQRRFSITSTWDVLSVNANQMRPLLKNTQRCFNHVFLLEQLEICLDGENLTQKQLHGLMTWKDTPKSVWKDTADWQTRKLSNCIVSSSCLDDH